MQQFAHEGITAGIPRVFVIYLAVSISANYKVLAMLGSRGSLIFARPSTCPDKTPLRPCRVQDHRRSRRLGLRRIPQLRDELHHAFGRQRERQAPDAVAADRAQSDATEDNHEREAVGAMSQNGASMTRARERRQLCGAHLLPTKRRPNHDAANASLA
ncbi:MAG TPA: hypothetical protein VNN06_03150 [Ramlibacter sp.]|nr:hypothetical protein [Ramlibacter sp.]